MASSEFSEAASKAPNSVRDQEWERKQRNREYRVAARREKRNRKADEKKQRKLNATILRRMTRNPDKYNKNAERNRLRDIEGERRRIWQEAVHQAQRLAAIHDPSGALFNVGPVVKLADGTVVSEETLRRREQKTKEKAAAERLKAEGIVDGAAATPDHGNGVILPAIETPGLPDSFNPDRLTHIDAANAQTPPRGLSKTQQKKRAALEPRPPPPKPTIPENISIPDGEEDWLALWDLPNEQLERRVLREKKRKAAERKALRVKQKSGKAERREARDEKRRVYREIKLSWKAIKEQTSREKTKMKSLEDEESRRIAVDVNIMERKAALEHCAALGFTLANTSGVDEVKPRALGMKGVDVDFNAIEIGESRSGVKPKQSSKRVDLGNVPDDAKIAYIPTGQRNEAGDSDEFIKLDVGDEQDFEALNYNHKLRRKLRRAIDNAEINKELLVRQRALEYYKEQGIEAPPVLKTSPKTVNVKGQRILDNGKFETAKQERVRARMELAEFNTQMRVLRKQAKDTAIYAGLRKHAELTGKLPPSEPPVEQEGKEDSVQASAADSPRAFQEPEITLKRNRSESHDVFYSDDNNQSGNASEASSSPEDSSESGSSGSVDEAPATKRLKHQHSSTKTEGGRRNLVNSDRQAMIDAESRLKASARNRENKKPNGNGSLRVLDTNTQERKRGNKMKGANVSK